MSISRLKKKQLLKALFLLSLVSLIIMGTSGEKNVKEEISKADVYFKEGSFRLAYEIYDKMLENVSKTREKTRVLYNMGLCAFKLNEIGDTEKALTALSKYKTDKLLSLKIDLLRARVLYEKDRYSFTTEALKLLGKIEKSLLKFPNQQIEDVLVDLYLFRINVLEQSIWQSDNYCTMLREDIEKLIPLLKDDEQKAALLFEFIQERYPCRQKLYKDDVIAPLLRIYKDYPKTVTAAKALLAAASNLESQKKYVKALDYYNLVIKEYRNRKEEFKKASEAVKRITSPDVDLFVPMVYKPSDKKQIGLVTRNLKSLEFIAYKVQLEDILQKVGTIEAVNYYQIPKETLITKKWALDMEDNGDYAIISKKIEFEETRNGAYIIEAKGNSVKVRSLLIISDLALVVKQSSNKSLVWVTDAITGRPVSKSDIFIATEKIWGNREILTESGVKKTDSISYFNKISKDTTDDAGIYIHQEQKKSNYDETLVIAKKAERYAVATSWGGYYYYGMPAGKYFYVLTDRPVYRPKQTVFFKAILREYTGEEYQRKPNENVKVEVYDAQGKKIKDIDLKINDFGSIAGSFDLEEKPSLGQYYLRLVWKDLDHYHYFRVEEYKKPEFIVRVNPAESQYRLGKDVTVKIKADYYFGEPVAGAEVKYRVERRYYYPYYYFPREYSWYYRDSGYDYDEGYSYRYRRPGYGIEVVKTGSGITDEKGELTVTFTADAVKNDDRAEKYYSYIITADVTDKSRRMITGQGKVVVGDKAFNVYLKPERYIYSPDDKVEIKVTSRNLSGEPVSAQGRMIIEQAKYNAKKKDYDYTKKDSIAFQIPDKGEGQFQYKAGKEGYYRINFQTADNYDQQINGYAWIWICGKDFHGTFYKYQGLEIVTDKEEYLPGETAQLLINCEVSSNAYALLTLESDILHSHRIVSLQGNSAMANMQITDSYAPNVWVSVNVVSDFKLFSAKKEIVVPPDDNFINVNVAGGRKVFKPGEKAKFEVATTDKNGKPVPAEVSLAIVDSSVFYIAPDTTEDIRKFFYGHKKEHFVNVSSSFDFQSRSQNVMYDMDNKESLSISGSLMGQARIEVSAAAPREVEARAKAEGAKKKNGGEELAEAKVRTDFRDTAFWAPFVVTGPDGKVVVQVDMPESLTTWQVTARGVTKDTMVGNLIDTIVTKKNIIVRLQAPRFFTERDEVTLSSVVHNYLEDDVKAKVYLKTEGIELIDKEPKWVDIKKDGDIRADFITKITQAGVAKITAFGQTADESDAMELSFPVIVHGVEKRFAYGGKVEQKKTLDFELPELRKNGASALEITIAPSIAGVILDCLQYLVDYPYGCVEQTMSRFLPAVVAAKTLKELGATNAKLEEKLPKVVKAGLDRLYDFQHSDGGWGWWKDDKSSLYMTSYVYYGLSIAGKAGYDIDNSRLKRAEKYMQESLSGYGNDLNTLSFALHALSYNRRFDGAAKEELEYVFKNREKLNAYARALLAVTFANIKDNERADLMLRNLYDFARVDKSSGTVSWSEREREWWYWYNDSVETTATALRAYIKAKPKSELVPMIVKWLVNNREGNRWKSTKDTALAVLSLTEYLKFSGELAPEYTARIYIGKKLLKEWNIGKKDIFDYGKVLTLKDPEIPEGKFEAAIEKDGTGELYYSASLKYFTKEEDIKGVSGGISIERRYYKVKEKGSKEEKRKLISNGDLLKSGDELEVELTINADNNYEYLVFEDYKPAGAEALTLVSGYSWEGSLGYQREMRDEKVVFFVNWLGQGTHTIKYRLRAEIPGSYHAMPTIGYAMYAPKIYALSDEMRFKIED